MAWTDIDLPRIPDLISSTFFTALKSDIEYLNRPNAATYHHDSTGGDLTVTGELGQTMTGFDLTITTSGGLVMACFYGMFICSTNGLSIRANIVHVDGVSHVGRNLFHDYAVDIRAYNPAGGAPESRGWIQFFPGLAAGSHNFQVVWGISPSGTGTLFVAHKPRFSVWEV